MATKGLGKKVSKVITVPFSAGLAGMKKVTAPIRSNKMWKKSRRTFLKSPFKGYFKDSLKELKQVTWPDRRTSLRLTGIVIVFSVIFAIITTLLDIGFDRLAKEIFLN